MAKNDPTANTISQEAPLEKEIDLDTLETYSFKEQEKEASQVAYDEIDISSFITDEPTGSEEITSEFFLREGIKPQLKEEKLAPIRPRISLRTVSGSYTCFKGSWELNLRIDIDGHRPLRCVSGDFFSISGNTKSYYGSFAVHGVHIIITQNSYVVTGTGTFTWNAGAPKIQIIIPQRNITQPPATVQLRFMTLNNQPGADYICYFGSIYFRTVQLEMDHENGVTPFRSYDTGLLPSGGARRQLSVSTSYKEAGIDMQESGEWNEIDTSAAGRNGTWSNSELHHAMELQFSMCRESPQWKVWLLAANKHDMGQGLYGIMFDQKGKQRQGCAAFHWGIGGNTAVKQRLQLYCYVHELGHCFNLFHSFHKSYMDPPLPNRLNALSWMNYPQQYRDRDASGEAAFWARFPFIFDTLEVRHLRHGFWMNVIMGGHTFGKGAALVNPADFAEPIEDNSGLQLQLNPTRRTFTLGEPVSIELKLSLIDLRGKDILLPFHPYSNMTQIAIRKPSGDAVVYKPLMEMCVEGHAKRLEHTANTIYESAYIGFGKDGFYFDQIGTYELRGVYRALDGSAVVSKSTFLRIRHPVDNLEEEIADVYLETDQGHLFWLEGSGSPRLSKAMDQLSEISVKYPDHRLASYARKTVGMNLIRGFKEYNPIERKIKFTKPKIEEGLTLLNPVLEVIEKKEVFDNIEMRKMTQRIAQAEIRAGDEKGARSRADKLIQTYKKMKLSSHIIDQIKDQVDTAIDES